MHTNAYKGGGGGGFEHLQKYAFCTQVYKKTLQYRNRVPTQVLQSLLKSYICFFSFVKPYKVLFLGSFNGNM